jgi:hypothetical protein
VVCRQIAADGKRFWLMGSVPGLDLVPLAVELSISKPPTLPPKIKPYLIAGGRPNEYLNNVNFSDSHGARAVT